MELVYRGQTFLTFAPEACARLTSLFPEDPAKGIESAEKALGQVPWQSEVGVGGWLAAEPLHAIAALATLADAPLSLAGERFAAIFPELAGLVAQPKVVTYEHQPVAGNGRPTPLLDQVLRSLAFALEPARSLDPATRALVTLVLTFADVAKGGTPAQKESWQKRLGVDGTVHNEDSAVILEDVFRRLFAKAPLSEDGRLLDRARLLCASSGLLGMRLRGEVSPTALGPLLELAETEADGGKALARAWSIINRAETSAVRAGLMTEELARAFEAEEQSIFQTGSALELKVTPLAERIARMRGGALMKRESPAEIEARLDQLGAQRKALEARLGRAQIWYAEPALGVLSLEACILLLLHFSGSAPRNGIETSRNWHLDLLDLAATLRDAKGEAKRYPVRLLEAILKSTRPDRLAQGEVGPESEVLEALVSFPITKGGEQALHVQLRHSQEAGALLTLLSVYETKASAAFHATLKALTDLYGLRKDDFDRVANEASYLATMNAARSDKARMLDYVVPGTIVEVGPGGGVVLDLLKERFPESRIIGLDASAAVIEALAEKTKARGYEAIHGDAFQLPKILGEGKVTTIVFCSVLHEIFSYVAWGEPPHRFQFAAVEAMVVAAFRCLSPGGRIVVRDGLMPRDEPRVVQFLDPVWRDGLDLFARSYEARTIPFEKLPDGRVRISAPDLYEFITTFTWGPDSFPYEIREQRGVLPRGEYVERLLAACRREVGARVREVPVPGDLASYLQPGYPASIKDHLKIFDGEGTREVQMPDVQGIWVIERT